MTHFGLFPARWPVKNPDIIQLYSLATPNGQKVSICLEEMALDYEPHIVDIMEGHQHDEDFLKINPNGKIPAIIDPNGPDQKPMLLMESAAILIYLADKSGKLLPTGYRERNEHLQWLFFQVGHIGPMFGQFGHFFLYAKDKTTDDYGKNRYSDESRRLLKVLDDRLEGRDFLMGDYSIVDIATCPWVDCLEDYYKGADCLGMDDFRNVNAWRKRFNERPAVVVGKTVCSKDS